jgi:hypothetical protein
MIAEAFGPVVSSPWLGARGFTAGLAQAALQYFTGMADPDPTAAQLQRDEALWRTLCCNLTASGEPAPERYAGGFQFWRMVFRITDNNGRIYPWLGDKALFEQHSVTSRELGYAMRKYTYGKSFCITQLGHFGSVPCCSMPGDTICIFKGGRAPFVVRPVGKGYYHLVGECYIHGIMNGQAMTRPDLESLEREFWIR